MPPDADILVPSFDRPVVILSAPRSGSTLLYELLITADDVWSIRNESHEVIECLPALTAAERGYQSNALDASDATPEAQAFIHRRFADRLTNRCGARWMELPRHKRPRTVRLIEKTPRNILRVRFLEALFNRNARYILLHRDPRSTIASISEAWDAPGFWQFKQDEPWCKLPGWHGHEWCMLLPDGWHELNGRPLEDIAAFQWRASYEAALDALEAVDATRWISLSYHDLVRDPAEACGRMFAFAGITIGHQLRGLLDRGELPFSSSVVSAPRPDKWRRREDAILRVLPSVEPVAARLRHAGTTTN